MAVAGRVPEVATDVGDEIARALATGKRVLLEGAQGTALDVDHGTYPYVTSSNTTAGAAAVGAGIGPTAIDSVVGVVKAYTTRVGNGPLPTAFDAEMDERVRELGGEFGATTGRPRRCGWFDAAVVAYAAPCERPHRDRGHQAGRPSTPFPKSASPPDTALATAATPQFSPHLLGAGAGRARVRDPAGLANAHDRGALAERPPAQRTRLSGTDRGARGFADRDGFGGDAAQPGDSRCLRTMSALASFKCCAAFAADVILQLVNAHTDV